MTQLISLSDLYNWLQYHFYRDNHPKYKHLFNEWIENITQGQVDGFSKQMYNEINKTLIL